LSNGQLGIINIKDGADIAYTGDTSGQHDVSPRHGLLIYRPYGAGAKPQINMADGTTISPSKAPAFRSSGDGRVYMRDLKFTWAGEASRTKSASESRLADGRMRAGRAVDVAPREPQALVRQRRREERGEGWLLRVGAVGSSWPRRTIDSNTLAGVNAEHQVYGSAGSTSSSSKT
jgi:hypothetical protein